MITLRFTYNPTWYNRAIKLYTWHQYTHVDLVFSHSASGGKGIYLSSLPGKGVCFHSEPAYKEKFVTLDVDAAPVFEFMVSQLGKPYDWGGVFSLGIHRNWHDENKWFCSELLAAAINKSKQMFSLASNKIVPRDIDLICVPR